STHRVSVIRAPPRPTLFPYTTLFRSDRQGRQFRGGLRTAGIRARPAARDPAWARPAATFALTSSACPASILARTHAPELANGLRSEEHTSELQSRENLVCRLLLEKKK